VELVLSENIGKFENVHRKLTNYIADYGKIKGEIILRNRRGGDRIKLIGRNCTSLVKKLFQQGTARSERSRMVILADESGVFFVEGFGFAERVKADSDTKTVLYCKISQNCHNDCLKY
jgi:tRNA(Ile)-lysidine synthase